MEPQSCSRVMGHMLTVSPTYNLGVTALLPTDNQQISLPILEVKVMLGTMDRLWVSQSIITSPKMTSLPVDRPFYYLLYL